MTFMLLGLFIKNLEPKVGLGGYEILFAYFVVEAKSKKYWYSIECLAKTEFHLIIMKFVVNLKKNFFCSYGL